MAFTDPQAVTISGSAKSLARTGSGVGVGSFGTNDGAQTMEVRHSYGKRVRRTIGLVDKKYSTDPARPDQNIPVSATVRLVVDVPPQGYTAADVEAILVGFMANLTAGTNANIKKLLGGEN
jgi:hypothetical protein